MTSRTSRPSRRRRRGTLDGSTIANRDEIASRDLRVLGPELDDAARRAAAAGAVGDLTYRGAGMTGIVFCDEQKTAYKVARPGAEGVVEEEAAWMARAAHVPGVREHVARGARYDKHQNVLVRECVIGPSGTPRHTSKLFKLHQETRAAMRPYGWLSPEFKEDSYVMARGRGPVLVDASMALRVGGELVRYAQAAIRSQCSTQCMEDLEFAIRHESGGTIPAKVADRLLEKIAAKRARSDRRSNRSARSR